MFAENFKESERVHACPSIATLQQSKEWTNQLRGAVVTDTEDSDSDDEDTLMTSSIYTEDSNYK